MREPFICLCPEITRDDALEMVRWLKDKEVRRYLKDAGDVSQRIRDTADRVGLPVLTHLFARDGRFYMVRDQKGVLVGFVRLVVKSEETEIVIVIGSRLDWGRRLGTAAILKSMEIAFFELRAPRMSARIHAENGRSLRAFLRAGFQVRRETQGMKVLQISMEEYIQWIGQGGSRVAAQVVMTSVDRDRLEKMIRDITFDGDRPEKAVSDLEREIRRARIVAVEHLSPDIVTMHSKVLMVVDDEEMEVSLVYPGEADWSGNKLSILSPIGTAILGYSEGDRIVWDVPSGRAEIRIKKLLYQPEAAGDYYL